jgi:hypothetical protein
MAMAGALVDATFGDVTRFGRRASFVGPTRLAICYPKVAQRHGHDVRIGYPLVQ